MSLLQSKQHSNYFEIIFHSPSNRNAFSFEVSKELLRLAKQAVKNKNKVLVFRGGGDYFCSGGDLQSLLKLKTKKAGQDLNSKIEKNLSEFAKLPLYKIAVVNGDCFGGGTELLSCFDLRLAASHVCFGFFQKRFHLTTGWGGFRRWHQQGINIFPFLASGEILSAYQALKKGLINETFSSGQLSNNLMVKINSLDTESEFLTALSKLSKQPKNEKQVFNNLWWSKHHQGALAKFKKSR